MAANADPICERVFIGVLALPAGREKGEDRATLAIVLLMALMVAVKAPALGSCFINCSCLAVICIDLLTEGEKRAGG